MSRKIAELNIELDCGGHITTYMPCKSEKHLMKKFNKAYDKGMDFGHFKVEPESVMEVRFKLHEVN